MGFNVRIFTNKFFHENRVKLLYFLSLLSLFIFSCTENNEIPPLPDLDIYLQRFEQEAMLRGYDFDLSQVEAVYVDEISSVSKSYCGYSYFDYNGTGLRRVEISTSRDCGWAYRSDIERENLFFHELGHAFFNRWHDESQLCDGSPLSIMASIPSNFEIYREGEDDKRTYYISELIDKMESLDQCIDYKQGWVNDSVFYEYTIEDESWSFNSGEGNFIGYESLEDVPKGASIDIESVAGSTTNKHGSYVKWISTLNIPECAEVTFKVAMNSDKLTGTGAAIAITASHSAVEKEGANIERLLSLSTLDHPITGKLNSHVVELTIPCYSRKTGMMGIFLYLMSGTEGKVSFNNIQLVVNKK
jgi:hypothetical protein